MENSVTMTVFPAKIRNEHSIYTNTVLLDHSFGHSVMLVEVFCRGMRTRLLSLRYNGLSSMSIFTGFWSSFIED